MHVRRFTAGVEKPDSQKFEGWNLNPASRFIELPPVEIDGPMTDERALALLDKIRAFEKHHRLRPLFDTLENRKAYAEMDREFAVALIIAEDRHQQEETEI